MTKLQKLSLSENHLRGPIPDAVAAMSRFAQLQWMTNGLSGALPDALGNCIGLEMLQLRFNELSGPIPGVLASIALIELQLDFNRFHGRLPDVLGSIRTLLILLLQGNQLSGQIPDAMWILTGLSDVFLTDNRLTGPIPDGIGSMSTLFVLDLAANKLSGATPHATGSMQCACFYLDNNRLSGCIPDALGTISYLRMLHLSQNLLVGTIPETMFSHPMLLILTAGFNKLSGSIGVFMSTDLVVLTLNDNQVEGTLPPSFSRSPCQLQALLFSGNMLEGTLPGVVPVEDIRFLDLSGQTLQTGLRGPLPLQISRARRLEMLMVSHHDLEGVIPACDSTFTTLLLHDNLFKVFAGANLKKDGTSVILVSNNLLSCHLPMCGDASASLSLSGLGNHLRHPDTGAFPAWVMPPEQDSLFWTSDGEGFALLLKVIGATSLLGSAVVTATRRVGLVPVMARWFVEHGPHSGLASFSSRLVSSMALETLICLGFFLYICSWDRYKCPETLAWLSACLRDDRFTCIAVVLLWSRLCVYSPAVARFISPHGRQGRAPTESAIQGSLQFLLWLLMTVVVSMPSILCLAANSVPGIFAGNELLLWIMSTSVGVAQGVLGSLVIPFLTRKLTLHESVLAPVAVLLGNFLFPIMVITYLDSSCLGRWVAFWEPCSRDAQRFQQELQCLDGDCSLLPHQAPKNLGWKRMKILGVAEICDPRQASGKTTVSHCTELALLRLQDIWLGKFITSGLVFPASRVVMPRSFTTSAELVGRLVVAVAFAMIASGYLLLILPLLLLAMLSETLVAAIHLHSDALKYNGGDDVASPTLRLTCALSTLVHLASVSGQPYAVALLCACILHRSGEVAG